MYLRLGSDHYPINLPPHECTQIPISQLIAPANIPPQPYLYRCHHWVHYELAVTTLGLNLWAMARKKVRLAWIANDSARRATFKKRRKGLMKKVGELSTLCDIQACAIVYGPYEPVPEVWPSPPEMARVLDRFQSLPQQGKKTLDQEKYMEQRLNKARDQLKRTAMENRALECAIFMHRCLVGQSGVEDLDVDALRGVRQEIDAHIKAVCDRLQLLESSQALVVVAPSADVAPTTPTLGPLTEDISEPSDGVRREMVLAEEMGPFDPGTELIKKQGMLVYNSPMFWPAEDAAGVANLPAFGDGDYWGGNGMQLPYLDAASSNATMSNYPLLDQFYYN